MSLLVAFAVNGEGYREILVPGRYEILAGVDRFQHRGNLTHLGRRHVAEDVIGLPEPIRQDIIERTDGVPLICAICGSSCRGRPSGIVAPAWNSEQQSLLKGPLSATPPIALQQQVRPPARNMLRLNCMGRRSRHVGIFRIRSFLSGRQINTKARYRFGKVN